MTQSQLESLVVWGLLSLPLAVVFYSIHKLILAMEANLNSRGCLAKPQETILYIDSISNIKLKNKLELKISGYETGELFGEIDGYDLVVFGHNEVGILDDFKTYLNDAYNNYLANKELLNEMRYRNGIYNLSEYSEFLKENNFFILILKQG